MTRLVLWSLHPDGWHRIAAVPVAEHRAAAALENARHYFILPAYRGLIRFDLEPAPLSDSLAVPALTGVPA